ncbi:hypothetical protein GCM10017786_36830 [Amycolatopsis deserti]|uniref:Uncharacterized protein n=1 Tax=Amycolatopsis deserti TaxID=185696 RepID=A0ABQ3J690_9PSEU|nr:hypothetical protein GCM10017786_36830 [Amycolatopsis deserti]
MRNGTATVNASAHTTIASTAARRVVDIPSTRAAPAPGFPWLRRRRAFPAATRRASCGRRAGAPSARRADEPSVRRGRLARWVPRCVIYPGQLSVENRGNASSPA